MPVSSCSPLRVVSGRWWFNKWTINVLDTYTRPLFLFFCFSSSAPVAFGSYWKEKKTTTAVEQLPSTVVWDGDMHTYIIGHAPVRDHLQVSIGASCVPGILRKLDACSHSGAKTMHVYSRRLNLIWTLKCIWFQLKEAPKKKRLSMLLRACDQMLCLSTGLFFLEGFFSIRSVAFRVEM